VAIDIILLAWILKHPAGLLPVVGTSNPKRIGTLMKATDIPLEIQEWFALWEASSGHPVA
jgi:predicted oxidoreductase